MMPRWAMRLACLLGALVMANAVAAQSSNTSMPEGPALLIADNVFITPDRTLVAEGNVEALQGDVRLQASRITFDRDTGKLSIEGPIRIDRGSSVTVLANSAELDEGLQNGLLLGARMVLDQQLQLASLQMTRVGGRYTQLYKTAVTSCHVCEDGSPPLWQIRARKVIHDQTERQLYFEEAQFLVLDVPVLYLPGFRLPDPTLDRARGFLIPSVRTTTLLGTGLRLPYFIPLGDHRDITLSPYVSSKTQTLDYRYRQAFRTGRVTFEGAYTRDDLYPDETRGYLFGEGQFDLPRGYDLSFDLKTVSDDGYLSEYDLPDLDRLRSSVIVSRYKRDIAFRAGVSHYKSLRDSDDEDTLPSRIFDATYERRYFPSLIGGEVRLGVDLHGHHRTSDVNIVGRDIRRATAGLNWQRSWIFSQGLRADWQIGLVGDATRIEDDTDYETDVGRATPSSAVTLRYPMIKRARSGATHVLEPVAQLGWTNVIGGDVPNDESTYVEFDQGNLLSLSRFPANDRREDGITFVYGLNWTRTAASGWQASASVGQVFRETADPDFTVSSGLSGTSSDILLAGQLKLDKGIALSARTLLAGDFSLSKTEVRGDWNKNRTRLSGTYLWLGTDPVEGRDAPQSEVWFDGTYDISPGWTAAADMRYDISDDRAIEAGVGLIYRNECVTVDLSIDRSYTSSSSVEPSTSVGFSISLNGFAVEGGTEKYRRSCS